MTTTLKKLTALGLAYCLCLGFAACASKPDATAKTQLESVPAKEAGVTGEAIPAEEAGMTGEAIPAEEAGMKVESVPASEAGMADQVPADPESFMPADYTIPAKDEYIYEFMGMKFKLSDKILQDMSDKKIAMLDDQSPIDQDLKYAMLTFDAMNEDQQNAVIDKMGEGYENWKNSLKRLGTLGMFHKDVTEKEITEITHCDQHQELGTSADKEYVYYLSTSKDADKDFAQEFAKTEVELIEKKARPENGFVLSEKSDLEGTVAFDSEDSKDLSKLQTKDIEGKAFTGEEFSKYDLTMVNVFATWCTACVKEIPDLVKLKDAMADKGVNIVGIVTDTRDKEGENAEAIKKAQLIHEKTHSNYCYLQPDESNFNGRLNWIQALPETFFVDSKGQIVGESYSGSRDFDGWKEIVEAELAKVQK